MITFFDKCQLLLYPFLLLMGSLLVALLGLFYFELLLIKILCSGISLYFFLLSIQLGSTLPSKVRSLRILVRKNLSVFHEESFSDYMKAPCGRQVVKLALRKLGRQNDFLELKRKYPLTVFWFERRKTRIVFYREGKEVN